MEKPMSHPFDEAFKDRYAGLISSMVVRPERKADVDAAVDIVLAHVDYYKTLGRR
jgi:hypothetical protein